MKLSPYFQPSQFPFKKKQMTCQKLQKSVEVASINPGKPSRSEDMSVNVWNFMIPAAGYNFF
jgi:hypothetical protein